jgi:hypothetical protein
MAAMLLVQWLICIPAMRRHRVVMALLERASIYQKRTVMYAKAGEIDKATAAYEEMQTLLAQAEELHKRGRKTP